jgi:hydrogenase small subunit
MSNQQTFLEALEERGVSRRSFMKFCAITASSLALAGTHARLFAAALASAPKPTVIWLSFQQCTGCSESILRSFGPALSVENLILNVISLDYHETLQVAAGDQAEKCRKDAMQAAHGSYVLIIDGSIPANDKEFWACIAGNSALAHLQEAVNGAGLVIALGTCAAFGGVPAALPNPSNAYGYTDLLVDTKLVVNPKMEHKNLIEVPMVPGSNPPKPVPFVNISGCPPMATVITSTIALYLTKVKDLLDGKITIDDLLKVLDRYNATTNPMGILDYLYRPKPFYGDRGDPVVHTDCPRFPHWEKQEFAKSYGDEGARQGYCLLNLGCRGPQARNSCTRLGWNTDPNDGGLFKNSPTHAGHNCLGCSEPNFWDTGFDGGRERFRQGFYSVQK